MAVNITEKDKTLNEIIDWCEHMEADGLRLANALLTKHDMPAYRIMQGQTSAYEKTADHCRSLLGHSRPTPSKTQNQNEDTKRACHTTVESQTRNPTTPPKRKNQEHDLPKHTTDNPHKETTE